MIRLILIIFLLLCFSGCSTYFFTGEPTMGQYGTTEDVYNG